uniref:Retrovirus-related Pol polyprotein from transposon TNT 1-94-like beta-barrel domain-containing protein n=1 Tax=Cannabis sativa TaxID=3483 RepID=A0A803PTR4_CANSA
MKFFCFGFSRAYFTCVNTDLFQFNKRALEQRFSSQSKARLLQLKSQFFTLRKGSLSISDYVNKMQSITDSLAIAGSPIPNQDFILQLLNGFGLEFDSVVLGITVRSDSLTPEEVQALLLSHESCLEHHNSVTDLTMKLQPNVAFSGSRTNPYRPLQGFKIGNRGGFCGSTISQPTNTSNHYPRALVTEHEFDYDPQAYATSFLLDFGDDSGWFVDTGATNNITSGIDNLDIVVPYTGSEGVAVGDGKKLSISHIGSNTLSSVHSIPLSLNSVLHVPSIKKNLVSVSQLTRDNNVFLEFHKTCRFVKDKQTGKVLLKGMLKEGLYVLADHAQ